MPNSDFMKCWVYEQLEPFGEKGDYLRAGTLTALTANIHRDTKRKQEPYTPSDFIPDVEYAMLQEQKAAQRVAMMMEAFAASNPGMIRVKPKKPANA